MAKAQSFKIGTATKTNRKTKQKETINIITIYTNVEQIEAEKTLIEFYLKQGYEARFTEKKQGESVEDMRKALKDDKETLEAFEKAYKEKNGFHNAMKIYSKWKKENKKK